MKQKQQVLVDKNKYDKLKLIKKAEMDELIELLNEPFGHETESYKDFKKATDRWRTK